MINFEYKFIGKPKWIGGQKQFKVKTAYGILILNTTGVLHYWFKDEPTANAKLKKILHEDIISAIKNKVKENERRKSKKN